MTSVITGDIVGSRKIKNPEEWMESLKALFRTIGDEPKVWQIFRGDSFQLEVEDVENTLNVAIQIKATIKVIEGLDVRMAIGIGSKTYDAPKIIESNGDAFVHSGELFEKMKKQNLALKSPWKDFDQEMNLYIELGLLTMDRWTKNSAEIVSLSLKHPNATQKELGLELSINQGNVSNRQKRSGFEEIMKVEQRYRDLLVKKIRNNDTIS